MARVLKNCSNVWTINLFYDKIILVHFLRGFPHRPPSNTNDRQQTIGKPRVLLRRRHGDEKCQAVNQIYIKAPFTPEEVMSPIAIILLIVLFVLGILFYLLAPAKARTGRAFITNRMFAHRGLHNQDLGIPENSLAAFKAAKDLGFGVELDVRLTKDGQVIVFHDDTLRRLCGKADRVRDLNYEDLCTLRLCDTEETIPLLSQALAVLDGASVICELKMYDGVKNMEELCSKTADLLKNYKGDYCVESFSPFALRWFMKNRPQIIRGQLSEDFEKPDRHTFVMKHLLVNFLGRPDFISYSARSIRPLGFHIVKSLGAVAVAWTIRSEAELDKAQKHFDAFIFEGMYNDRINGPRERQSSEQRQIF